MSTESDIDAIDARVAKSQSTSADGVSVTRRSVSDEIAWDEYKRKIAAQEAAQTHNKLPFQIFQIVSSGGPR